MNWDMLATFVLIALYAWIFIITVSLGIYYLHMLFYAHRKNRQRKLSQFELMQRVQRETEEYTPTLKEIERFYKRLRKGIHRANELLALVHAPYHIKLVKVWDRPEENPNQKVIETELPQNTEDNPTSNPT